MENELTCNQVIALLSFYEEDKLNTRLKEYVDEHLSKCKKCREIYMKSAKIAKQIINLNNEAEKTYMTKQYDDFRHKLSSYIDNELDEHESIRIKKIAISNPLARKDLEEMYTFKKLLHNSFEKTRSECKNDFSKAIINKLEKNYIQSDNNSILKIIYAFTTIISIIVVGMIATLYF